MPHSSGHQTGATSCRLAVVGSSSLGCVWLLETHLIYPRVFISTDHETHLVSVPYKKLSSHNAGKVMERRTKEWLKGMYSDYQNTRKLKERPRMVAIRLN
jgi:hypothetical protein